MGSRELLAALNLRGEHKAREIWRRAEREAQQLRTEAEEQLAREAGRLREDERRTAQELIREAELDAERTARRRRVEVKHALVERLHQEARAGLKAVRGEAYEELFAALVAELPPLTWERVRVNAADRALARKYLAAAEIETDATIVGGLQVRDVTGRIQVDNTLEKRLERAWGALVPVLLAEVEKGVAGR